jgi:hypothetical protein
MAPVFSDLNGEWGAVCPSEDSKRSRRVVLRCRGSPLRGESGSRMFETKNRHAVALGRLGGIRRAENLSAQELSEIGRLGGYKGGKARAQALTASERTAIASNAGKGRLKTMSKTERSQAARLAAKARWNKRSDSP